MTGRTPWQKEHHGRKNIMAGRTLWQEEHHDRKKACCIKRDIGSADEHVIYIFTWLWNKETRSEE